MKGMMFHLLEAFALKGLGKQEYEQVLSGCTLKTKGITSAVESYPYEDFLEILRGVGEALGIPRADLLRDFGKFAFPKLAGLFLAYVVRYPGPKEFLLDLDSIIHAEVEKRFQGAAPPRFVYKDPGRDRLIMEYHSPRGLCHFMEGMIEGVAETYPTTIGYKQTRCCSRGDPLCEFDLRFKK